MKKNRLFLWIPLLSAVLLTLVVFLFLWRAEQSAAASLARGEDEYKTVLLAGVDDVGANTDVLLLCALHKKTGTVKAVQIPRDTYYKTEKSAGKINRIFRANSSKYGRKRAAENLCEEMGEALGIPIDGYAVFGTRTLGTLTELLGGVRVDVPTEITYTDGKTGEVRHIPKGEQRLSGDAAIAFVRHRRGYTEGDLGRLDAQMRFLGGVAEALPRLKNAGAILTIYKKILPNLLTNLGEKDIMEVMMVYLAKSGSTPPVRFMRLPGEPCYTEGAWYYVLHRAAAERMLKDELGLRQPFDPNGCFTDEGREAVRNIYTEKDSAYDVYTADEARRKRILQ